MDDVDQRSDGVGEFQRAAELEAWLEQYGDQLFAYARARVADDHEAEELVQETFLAAFKNQDQFAGRASPGTWLTAILRHKLINHYRRESRRPTTSHETPIEEILFDERGIWKVTLGAWPKRPEREMERAEFWQVFRNCLQKLPKRIAEVFVLRVLDDMSSEMICKELNVSPANLGVRLHRARLGLRTCLGKHWFGED
jgi:RNA polymerase sigma-70 factor (ECF subfamily)